MESAGKLELTNGSRVAVIGGGPAGSFFTYFLLGLAKSAEMDLHIDVYEPKDFTRPGPPGCNHCGGVVSESLVQILAAEGIRIPSYVVQRGMESYVFQTDGGIASIKSGLGEKRIAAMYRGAGPRGTTQNLQKSFDGFLLNLCVEKGANVIREKVTALSMNSGRPNVSTQAGRLEAYDLVVGTVGINANSTKLFEDLGFQYDAPDVTRTYICEFFMDQETITRQFGNAMHAFLLKIPRLEFAALIPKNHSVTMCLIGDEINQELVTEFLNHPTVKRCFPPDFSTVDSIACQCYPKINVNGSFRPFADRVVLIGDCAVSRLYKDGIGSAYYAGKSAASTAVFHGISADAFRRHYWKTCQAIHRDNAFGKVIFFFSRIIQSSAVLKKAVVHTIVQEQKKRPERRHLSMTLWDTFSGSASYTSIFKRFLHPSLLLGLGSSVASVLVSGKNHELQEEVAVASNELGKVYKDGESIVVEGEMGDCMYVIQSGNVLITHKQDGKDVRLAELHEGDFFGEMALFTREVRSSTVRAIGSTTVITVDKKTLLKRINLDPTLAFRIIEKMSVRIRDLNALYGKVRGSDRRDWETRPDKKAEY